MRWIGANPRSEGAVSFLAAGKNNRSSSVNDVRVAVSPRPTPIGWLKLDATVAAGVDGPPRVHNGCPGFWPIEKRWREKRNDLAVALTGRSKEIADNILLELGPHKARTAVR